MNKRLPPWLIPACRKQPQLKKLGRHLAELGVNTVCQSARCPNIGECFGVGNATFMIMGNVCTRNCRFCAVEHDVTEPLDAGEPTRIAEAAKMMELKYVVVTSVTRDDLPDGGARHFAATISALRRALPEAKVEVLAPDFLGNVQSVRTVLEARPDVFGHNVETVSRLYPKVRPQADYKRSLEVLHQAYSFAQGILTKSGLMVGLGETEEEVLSVFADLRKVGVGAVTVGQYLQPTRKHLPVQEYVSPEVFERYATAARALGFDHVMSGPLVRSSYHAEELTTDKRMNTELDSSRSLP